MLLIYVLVLSKVGYVELMKMKSHLSRTPYLRVVDMKDMRWQQKVTKLMLSEVDAFADFFAKKLTEHPNAQASPWRICLYSDEIIPGNALKPRNDRKLVAFYWTFSEMDAAVGHEDLWCHIVAVRSSVVRSMRSGWSQLFKHACSAFFSSPFDMSKGVVLIIKGHGARMFWAKIGILVGDEPCPSPLPIA